MSQDLANKLPETDSEKLTLILTSVQALRPIWQQVVADILQLQEGQRALSTEVRAMRRDIDQRFGLLYDKLVDIEIDHRDIHDRVTRLELNANPPNAKT